MWLWLRQFVVGSSAIGAVHFFCHDLLVVGRRMCSVAWGVGRAECGRTASRGVRFCVIHPADINSEFGSTARAWVVSTGNTFPQLFHSQRHTGDGELSQALPETGQPMLFLAIQGNGLVRPVLQATLDQVGEHGAGPDLDKGAHSGRIHGLDLFGKTHRLDDLTGECLADGVWRIGIGGGNTVCVD